MTEDIRQLSRRLAEKVLDKAGEDPQFKQQLLDDPEAAVGDAGFPEVQELQDMQQNQDVTAQEYHQQYHQLIYTIMCPQGMPLL